jgi:hypothetical protein
MLLSSAIVSAVGTHGAATKGHTYHWHKGIDSIAALLGREVHTAGGVGLKFEQSSAHLPFESANQSSTAAAATSGIVTCTTVTT